MGCWESEGMPDDGYILEFRGRDQHAMETRVLHTPGVRVECRQDDMSDIFHRGAIGHKVRLDTDEWRESKICMCNVAAEIDIDPIQVGEVFDICTVEDGHKAVVVPR